MASSKTEQTYELLAREIKSPSKHITEKTNGTRANVSESCCEKCCSYCKCFTVTMRAVLCILFCVILFPLVLLAVKINFWSWNRDNVSGGACPVAFEPTYLAPITQLARAAFCQYDQQEEMPKWECDPCKKSGLAIVPGTYRPVYGDYISPNSTYAYVVKLSNKQGGLFSSFRSDNPYYPFQGACVIAFRGSLNFFNTIMNVDFPPTLMGSKYNCPNCLVHHGFFRAWQSMEAPLVSTLKEIDCGSSPLIITGHSLGAAMATFATWTLTQVHGFDLSMFYSFESPRVGDPAFHHYFNSKIVANKPAFRFTYYNDAVPHLPPADTGFEHVNCEIYYDEQGNYKVCHDEEDPTCSMSWNALHLNFDLNGEINGSGAHCHPSYEATGHICWC